LDLNKIGTEHKSANLTRRMKNRHFYIQILLIQISAVGLILRETQLDRH